MASEHFGQRCSIGPFVLDAKAAVLMRGPDPVPLGRRAVALLRLLVERAGEIVTKDELIGGAWNGLTVEESNLTVQIAALRRLFAGEPSGARWIETLPRRGYRFVGPIAAAPSAITGRPHGAVSARDGLPVLAVLPFRTLGPDPARPFLADALEEDTITALAGLSELIVISRGSTFRFRDTGLDHARIGQELGARYLVTGSVRQTGDTIRVSVELAEAESGAVLSARLHEAETVTRFDALDGIVSQIVRALPRGCVKRSYGGFE